MEVDETCGLETMEDGLSGGETLGGGAREEVGEIYELERSVSDVYLGGREGSRG